MLRPLPALACLLAACATPGPSAPTTNLPPATPAFQAEAPVWPAGRPFAAQLAPGAPDEAPWRAMAVWWREALRQSAALRLDDTGAAADRLELAVDPNARTATATWTSDGVRTVLAVVRFPDGDVPGAIDRVATAARAAVGDDSPAVVGCAAGTSARHQLVDACADAQALMRDGGFRGARRILLDARRRDPKAPWLLDALAACEAALGDHGMAATWCDDALAETARLLPTTRHRLQRTRLLARAAQQPVAEAATIDAELRRFADEERRARPFDVEPLRTEALALALEGDFAAAAARVDELLAGDGDAANTLALAGHVRLALGEPKAAAAHFAAVRGRLPVAATLLAHAQALHAVGDLATLRELLARALDDAQQGRDPFEVDVRRMRAALAVAEADEDALRAELRTILGWLVAHPTVLAQRLGEFAAQAAMLLERGERAEVERLLDAAAVTPAGGALATTDASVRGAATPQALAALRACRPDDGVRLRGAWAPPMRGPEWMAARLGR